MIESRTEVATGSSTGLGGGDDSSGGGATAIKVGASSRVAGLDTAISDDALGGTFGLRSSNTGLDGVGACSDVILMLALLSDLSADFTAGRDAVTASRLCCALVMVWGSQAVIAKSPTRPLISLEARHHGKDKDNIRTISGLNETFL